jgi:DHA2 family multidrug resistance protein
VSAGVQLTRARRNLVAGAAILASTLQTLDTTIANTALPTMQGALSASHDQIAWVVTAYAVAAAIGTAPTAWLAERFGHRRVFALSILVFTATSLLCALATNAHQMALVRFLQGLGGAALMPLSQAILALIFPPEARARVFAAWILGALLGPILGPVIGGWLTEEYSWRWIFLMNLPLGLMTATVVWTALPDLGVGGRPRFNVAGFLLLTVAVGCLQLVLDRGHSEDWFSSPEIVTEAVLSAGAFYFFVVHMLRAREPFLPLALFRNPTFTGSVVLAMIATGLLFTIVMLMPTMLQTVYGYPVLTAGIISTPRGFGVIAATIIVTRYLRLLGTRNMAIAGLACIGISMHACAGFSLDTNTFTFVWTAALQGFGVGLAITPLQVAAFNALPAKLQTHGATVFGLGRNLGGSVLISIMVTQLARYGQSLHERLTEHVTVFDAPTSTLPGLWNWGTTAGASLMEQEVARQAVMLAYLNVFTVLSIIAFAAIPLVLLLRRPEVAPDSRPPPPAAD